MIYRDGVPIVYRAVDFVRLLDLAQERAEYDTWRRRQKDYRAAEPFHRHRDFELCRRRRARPLRGRHRRDRRKRKSHRQAWRQLQGQSHETTMAQVCAHTLGAAFDDVRVLGGDTDLMRVGFGTGASRVAINTGNAVHNATIAVRRKVVALAAQISMPGAGDHDCREYRVGHRRAAEPHHAGRTRRTGDARQAHGGFRGTRPGCNRVLLSRNRHLGERCEYRRGLKLTATSGKLTSLKYVFVHDRGVQLNPKVVEGQIAGGFAQGLSIALGERVADDGEGQLLSGSLMDYYVPRANDVPDLDLAHITLPSPDNPLGLKSVGESGPNSPGRDCCGRGGRFRRGRRNQYTAYRNRCDRAAGQFR